VTLVTRKFQKISLVRTGGKGLRAFLPARPPTRESLQKQVSPASPVTIIGVNPKIRDW